MAKKIIYGVGQAVLRKFADKSKIIGYTDLQDLSFESSFSKEDITSPELKVYHPKDFTEIQYDELKKLLEGKLEQLKTTTP